MAEINTGLPVFQFEPQVADGGGVRASGAAPTLGLQGGNTTASVKLYADTTDIGAGSRLPEFMEGLFAEKIQAVKNQRAWQGYIEAAAGKSARDIADEQPWYSRLFGSTPYELGAQHFNIRKAGSSFSAAFTDNIGKNLRLEERSPEEVLSWAVAQATALNTGDMLTDVQLQKVLMDNMGPMMDVYTKARVEWQQTKLSGDHFDMGEAAGDAFHSIVTTLGRQGTAHPDQSPDPEGLLQVRKNFREAFDKPESMEDGAWYANVARLAETFAHKGQFGNIEEMREAGILAALPPEMRLPLEDTVRRRRDEFYANLDDPEYWEARFTMDLAAGRGDISSEGMRDAAVAFNSAIKARYGDPVGPLGARSREQLSATALGQTLAAMDEQWKATQRAAASALTEQEKRQAEKDQLTFVVSEIRGGRGGFLKDLGIADTVVESAMLSLADSGVGLAPVLAMNNGMAARPRVYERMKDTIRNWVDLSGDGHYSPSFQRAVDLANSLQGYSLPTADGVDRTTGPATALQYFGADRLHLITEFNRNLENMDTEAAYQLAVRSRRPRPPALTKEAGNAIVRALPGTDNLIMRILGVEKRVPREHRGWMVHVAAEEYARVDSLFPQWSVEEKARTVAQNLQSFHGDIAGIYSWPRVSPQQEPLSTYGPSPERPLDTNVYGAYLQKAIDDALSSANVDVDSRNSLIEVFRGPDGADGWPRLYIHAQDGDSGIVNVSFGRKEFERIRNETAEFDITKRQQKREWEQRRIEQAVPRRGFPY